MVSLDLFSLERGKLSPLPCGTKSPIPRLEERAEKSVQLKEDSVPEDEVVVVVVCLPTSLQAIV